METVLSPLQIVYIRGTETSAENVRCALESADPAVDLTVVDSGTDTGSLLDERSIDCVLSEYPAESGTEIIERLREAYPDLPVVFVLTDERATVADDAVAAGATEYVRQSALRDRPEIFRRRIRAAVEHARRAATGSSRPTAATPDEITFEGALREHVAEAVVGNFPNGAVTLVGTDLRYRLAGGQLFEKLPSDPDDVIDTHVGDLESGDRDVFVQSYRDALDGTETATETLVEGVTLLHRTVPVYDADGSVVAAVGMTQDITDRKEHERELERNREFLDSVQSVANIGGWEVDLRSETLRWTDEVYRIHEIPSEYDPILAEGMEFYHPDDRETIEQAYEELVSTGESFDMELRIVTANDTVRWVRTRGEPWTDDEGKVVGARGTFQDITERREHEQELQRKSRAIEAAPIGITMTDPEQDDNPLIYANQQFLETSGYDREEVLGRNCRFMQGEETDPETVARIREGIDAEEPVAVGIKNYRKDGTTFWNHLEIAPVHDDHGELINYVGFQKDITERVEYERELEKSRSRYRTLVEHFPNGAVALVDEELRYITVGGTPIDAAWDAETELMGQPLAEVLTDEMAAELRPRYADALEGDQCSFETEVGDRCYQFRIVPVRADDGSVFAAMGVSQDITEQKERERSLQKRERVLRELHAASREFYPPDSMADISPFVVDFLQHAFDFSYVSVKRFDEGEGVLQPVATSALPEQGIEQLGPVEPGDNPLWNAYRDGESVQFSGELLLELFDADGTVGDHCLAVPIGNFGLIVVVTAGDRSFDGADRDLLEVLATNAEAIFQSLQHDRERETLAERVETQQETLEELRGVIDAVQAIQARVANSETRDELETGVCTELVETDSIDFAWIGRPKGSDTDLDPTAWTGERPDYLDSVLQTTGAATLPAEHAAARREPYAVASIPKRVMDEQWAKEALSRNFRSALSVPLIYDDVLYGVLTVYSSREAAFEEQYRNLVTDVGSLLVTYSRVLQQRYASDQAFVELEFELDDPTYPLQRLARETGSRIEYDTVTETVDGGVRTLVTVTEGDPQSVLALADSTPSIAGASQFGDDTSRQLRLTIAEPFLASEVGKHGGRLLEAASTETGTRLRIALPESVSSRPLFDTLTTQYREIDLLAQRQRVYETEPAAEALTDRQYEILNAAYHSGYYDVPRNVTGEALAAEFDISGPALYKHLQAAHSKVFEQYLRPETSSMVDNGGLDA